MNDAQKKEVAKRVWDLVLGTFNDNLHDDGTKTVYASGWETDLKESIIDVLNNVTKCDATPALGEDEIKGIQEQIRGHACRLWRETWPAHAIRAEVKVTGPYIDGLLDGLFEERKGD